MISALAISITTGTIGSGATPNEVLVSRDFQVARRTGEGGVNKS